MDWKGNGNPWGGAYDLILGVVGWTGGRSEECIYLSGTEKVRGEERRVGLFWW